jgi:UDP-glucuronate 4-epimerase
VKKRASLAKYFITGGAGFIGSHLSEKLLIEGNDIVILDNLDPFYSVHIKEKNLKEVSKTSKKQGRQLDVVRGDIRDKSRLQALFREHRFDGVVHLAAKAGVRPSLEDPVGYWDVNCVGSASLLESAREAGIKRLVFASSSSVYGNCKTAPFSEDMFVGAPVSPYAATKRAGELMCYNFSHLYDLHIVCIRFFTVYGPRQRPDLAIHKFSRLIAQGKPIPFFGDGTSERDYTYISDIVEGTVKALEYARTCPFDIINLGESNTISLKLLVRMLEQALGKKARKEKLPFQTGDVPRTWADISRAKEKLDYRPGVSKSQGIAKFMTWLKAQPDFSCA